MTQSELPSWVAARLPDCTYGLTMFDSDGQSILGLDIGLDREEFILLREKLAMHRGYALPDEEAA